MVADDRSSASGSSTPSVNSGSRPPGARRAARPVDADSESTILMHAVRTQATTQTYASGRRAKAPQPVQDPVTPQAPSAEAATATSGRRRRAGGPAAAHATPREVELPTNENTIVFPAVGDLPEGKIPGARRARARAATRSAARGRMTAFAGVAAVAVAAIGSLTFTAPAALLAGQDASLARSYVGANGTNAVDVSRNYDRELAVQKPMQASQIAKALAESKATTLKSAEKRQDEKIRNQWVVPVIGYRLTARFGQGGGLWSSGAHTGLDFAGPSGSQIVSVAAGTVTSTGYEGAYGNRTVITLADGTEIWYCHQSAINVTVGEQVAPGDPIGLTGSTGNVTGPHLHLEVHPGAGNAVDPYAALVAHGVTP